MRAGLAPVTSVIEGTLSRLAPPRPLVFVAKGWPTALIVAVLLGMPVSGAYLDVSILGVLSDWLSQHGVVVKHLADVDRLYLPDTITLVVSGPVCYVKEELSRLLRNLSSVLWIVEQSFRGKTRTVLARGYTKAERACSALGLHSIRFPHSVYGGATSALHVIGFSPSFGVGAYAHPSNVRRTLRHFWKPAEPLKHPISLLPPPEFLGLDFDRPLKLDDSVFRCEGVLPIYHPLCYVCGPTVFYPGQFVRRRLSREELLAVFDIPSPLQSTVLDNCTWNSTTELPFESSVSPVVLTSLFRQLWSCNMGRSATVAGSIPSSVSSSPDAIAPTTRPRAEDVNLGVCLPPNPGPNLSNETEDDELSVSSSVTSTTLSYRSFDTSSAEDSFMPRRKGAKKECCIVPGDWEFLDDVSIDNATVETDNTSLSSFYEEDQTLKLALADALPSHSITDSPCGSISDSSIASAATITTRGTISGALGSNHKQTAAEEILKEVESLAIGKKAVRADDASVPVGLWNSRVKAAEPGPLKDEALTELREFGLVVFRRALYLDCMDYLEEEFGKDWRSMLSPGADVRRPRLNQLRLELDAVRNILWHASETNWFEYLSGSRLHHFRFPLRYRKEARDGTPIYFEWPGPESKQRQPDIKPEMLDAVRSKILKVIRRRYLVRVRTSLDIKSLIKFFAVPKGERDIRMVYDATASGLNAAVWTPSFWLPTIDSLIRPLENTSWMTDRDVGDMFLNFPLHKSARIFAGVDIKPILKPDDPDQHRWYQWARNAMGFSPSPYNSIKMSLVVEEIIKGDRFDLKNPFQWEFVRLNLPGTRTYDPSKPWIVKVRGDGLSASELFTFVDDERVAGATDDNTWAASHAVGSKQSYVGMQDAARKADICTQQARAWAGAVVHVIPEKGVCVLTSDEKWLKTKGIISKWLDVLEKGAMELEHKELLSDRGFLVYVTRAYPPMIPYFKGFHLTAEMW